MRSLRERLDGTPVAPAGGTMRAISWREVSWVTLFLLLGCGGKHDTAPLGNEPVVEEECQHYEAELKRCFHRSVSFAAQPSLVAESDAQRARVRALCSDNLQRLRQVCQ